MSFINLLRRLIIFTGSILVACANFGAFVIGGDIDPRVLRGATKLNHQKKGNVVLAKAFDFSSTKYLLMKAGKRACTPIFNSTDWKNKSSASWPAITRDPAGGIKPKSTMPSLATVCGFYTHIIIYRY